MLNMATISKTKYGKRRSLVRISGWPATSKNFRIKRDAETWARVTEDEMIRGAYAPSSQYRKTIRQQRPRKVYQRSHSH